MRIYRLLVVFIFLFLFGYQPAYPQNTLNFAASSDTKEEILSKTALDARDGVLIIRLCGTPYEMGYQHGALLKGQIRDFFSNDILGYLNSEEKRRSRTSYPHMSLLRYFRSKAQSLERNIPDDYRKELKGLADGCGLSYEDILLMHVSIDIASSEKLNLNSKLRDILRERKVIIFYNPSSGNSFVTIGRPGIIGTLTGMNEQGLTVEESGYSKTPAFTRGTPLLFLLRQALQYSDSYYDAVRIIASSSRSVSARVIISDIRTDSGCVIDFDPAKYEVSAQDDKTREVLDSSLNYFRKFKDEFGIKVAQRQPIDPFEFFGYEKKVLQYDLEAKEKTKEYEHYSFSYPSAVVTDYPDNTVYLDFYEPKGRPTYPAIIFLSHLSGGIPQIEGEFCRDLASNGIAVLLIRTAYQKNYQLGRTLIAESLKSKGADELVQLLRQYVIEARRGIDWLENQPKVKKDKIGLMGISLGGIMVPVVAGVDDRIKSMAIMLSGGDMGDIMWNSYAAKIYKERLIGEGVNSAWEVERKMWMLDPLTYAFKVKKKSIIMVNALFDPMVPKQDTVKLWHALEQPKLIWLPTFHFTSTFVMGYAKIKVFQYFYAELISKEKASDIEIGYYPNSPLSSFTIPSKGILGHKAALDITVRFSSGKSGGSKSAKVGVVAKELFDRSYFGGGEAFGRHEKDGRYHLTGVGGDAIFGIRLTENTHGYLKYSYETVKVYDVESWAPYDFHRTIGRKGVSVLSFNWERNTFDDLLYPIDGSYRAASFGIASRVFGGNYNFMRATGEARWYITTPFPKITFVFRVKGGWMSEYGESVQIPFFERFTAGGEDTIRGYKSRSLGPRDSNNLPLWGDVLLLGNIETRFPLFKGLNGAIFYDVGNTWEHLSSVRLPKDLQNSVGAGLRYRTKWAVLRFDYGYPFNNNEEGRKGRFHFGLGVPF